MRGAPRARVHQPRGVAARLEEQAQQGGDSELADLARAHMGEGQREGPWNRGTFGAVEDSCPITGRDRGIGLGLSEPEDYAADALPTPTTWRPAEADLGEPWTPARGALGSRMAAAVRYRAAKKALLHCAMERAGRGTKGLHEHGGLYRSLDEAEKSWEKIRLEPARFRQAAGGGDLEFISADDVPGGRFYPFSTAEKESRGE